MSDVVTQAEEAQKRVWAERDRYKAQVEELARLVSDYAQHRYELETADGSLVPDEELSALCSLVTRIQSENSTEGGDVHTEPPRSERNGSRPHVTGGGPAEQSGSAPDELRKLLVRELLEWAEGTADSYLAAAPPTEINKAVGLAHRRFADRIKALLDTNAEEEGT